MVGDLILFLKSWWKQNITCRHEYVYKDIGRISFKKMSKVWKNKKLHRLIRRNNYGMVLL